MEGHNKHENSSLENFDLIAPKLIEDVQEETEHSELMETMNTC